MAGQGSSSGQGGMLSPGLLEASMGKWGGGGRARVTRGAYIPEMV